MSLLGLYIITSDERDLYARDRTHESGGRKAYNPAKPLHLVSSSRVSLPSQLHLQSGSTTTPEGLWHFALYIRQQKRHDKQRSASNNIRECAPSIRFEVFVKPSDLLVVLHTNDLTIDDWIPIGAGHIGDYLTAQGHVVGWLDIVLIDRETWLGHVDVVGKWPGLVDVLRLYIGSFKTAFP